GVRWGGPARLEDPAGLGLGQRELEVAWVVGRQPDLPRRRQAAGRQLEERALEQPVPLVPPLRPGVGEVDGHGRQALLGEELAHGELCAHLGEAHVRYTRPPYGLRGALEAGAGDLEPDEAGRGLGQGATHGEAAVAEADLELQGAGAAELLVPVGGERQGSPGEQRAAHPHASSPAGRRGRTSSASLATRLARTKVSRESSRNG